MAEDHATNVHSPTSYLGVLLTVQAHQKCLKWLNPNAASAYKQCINKRSLRTHRHRHTHLKCHVASLKKQKKQNTDLHMPLKKRMTSSQTAYFYNTKKTNYSMNHSNYSVNLKHMCTLHIFSFFKKQKE